MIASAEYCDSALKRLVVLKAGLYDILVKAGKMDGNAHTETIDHLKNMVTIIETGIDELKNQCPADWSPNKNDLNNKMEEMVKTLTDLAAKLGVIVPDTTAWI